MWQLIPIVTFLLIVAYKWIIVYNDYQFLSNKATQKINDVNIILKQRVDNIYALTAIVQRYTSHEYSTIKETIGERGKSLPNETIEEVLANVKAVSEQYPTLKADSLFGTLMDKDSTIELSLRDTRKEFNRIVQTYNTMICQFPRNIVAKLHNIGKVKYFAIDGFTDYEPKDIMG